MRYLIFISILICNLFITSTTFAFITTGIDTIWPGYYFDFSTQQHMDWGQDGDLTVGFVDPGGQIFEDEYGMIYMGFTHFDSIYFAPDPDSSCYRSSASTIWGRFCAITAEEHYVKFDILYKEYEVVIEWAYQNDGSRNLNTSTQNDKKLSFGNFLSKSFSSNLILQDVKKEITIGTASIGFHSYFFDFSHQPADPIYADIYYDDYCGANFGTNGYLYTWITDVGKIPFDSLRTAPNEYESIYREFEKAKLNHTYCVYTTEGHWGKLTVTTITDSSIEFIWAYQNDGSENLDTRGLTSIDENNSPKTKENLSSLYSFTLFQNYPNPFNPKTKIPFGLSKKSYITLKIYNLHGQLVKTLFEGWKDKGYYLFSWNGLDNYNKEVASGVYLYKLTVSSNKILTTKIKQMLLLN